MSERSFRFCSNHRRLNSKFINLMQSLLNETPQLPWIYEKKIKLINCHTKIIPICKILEKMLEIHKEKTKPELINVLKHVIWRLQIIDDILQQLNIECQRRMRIVLKMLYYDNQELSPFYSSEYTEHIEQKRLLYALEDTLCEYNDNPSKYSPKKVVAMICQFAKCDDLPSIMATTIYNFYDIAPFVEDEIRKKDKQMY